ncbi:MAG: 50S ribosomal protein L28 [Firmicutes bacterium]|jgi:large subunit ribosomal protein L28|nr:50S ribosomal protein L28 [Bacillota bacterium]
MSNKCYFCGREKKSGFMISHSHIRTKRSWKPNIQKIKAIINGAPQRVHVCTRCLKSGKVKRAI